MKNSKINIQEKEKLDIIIRHLEVAIKFYVDKLIDNTLGGNYARRHNGR